MINITEGFIEGKACRGRRRRTWFSDVAEWLECTKYGKRMTGNKRRWSSMIVDLRNNEDDI